MVATTFCFLSQVARAQDELPSGKIAVESPENYAQAYKQRRSKHGVLFSIGVEKFYPFDYKAIKENKFIEDLIGTDRIDLVGFEIGYKHNISIGSISALFNYAKGSKIGKHDLDLAKQGLSANVALDALFDEPWVVPYIQMGAHQMSITDTSTKSSQSGSASLAINYRYGLLFQINWIEDSIDKTARIDALRSSGLENTYIDVYFAQYMPSGSARDPSSGALDGEPNLASSGEMGLALKLEF